MSKRNFLLWAALGILALGLIAAAVPQEKKFSAVPSPEKITKMMDQWLEVIEPGEHHKALEHRVGKWTTTTKIFMGGPDSPATETEGTSEVRWVLGGRFIMENFKGKMLMPDREGNMRNVDIEGIGFLGYDNYKNMYVGSWMDNLGTQMLTMKGSLSPSGNSFTLYGEMDEPMLDVQDRMVKFVLDMDGSDRCVYSVYDLHAEDDYKVQEITYKRIKE